MNTRTARVFARRRALAVFAAAAGLALAPGGLSGARPPVHVWRGRALGAEASLLLAHPDRRAALAMVDRCLAEIERLERIFSLQRTDSELAALNRSGRLTTASSDLRLVLAEAIRLGELSGGAFDVTVQPLWELYARHFRDHPDDLAGPDPRALARTLRLVDHRALALERGGVALGRPGMAVTLNGIAQGYITDRVAELLRASGFTRVLVQLGETRALAPADAGRPWRVALPDPAGAGEPLVLGLADRAIATSSGLATRFERTGRHHHLFDPASGRSAAGPAAVSVVTARALIADGLSTALAILPPEAARPLLAATGGGAAHYLLADGRRHVVVV